MRSQSDGNETSGCSGDERGHRPRGGESQESEGARGYERCGHIDQGICLATVWVVTHDATDEKRDNHRLGSENEQPHDDEADVVLMEPDDRGHTGQRRPLNGQRPHDGTE